MSTTGMGIAWTAVESDTEHDGQMGQDDTEGLRVISVIGYGRGGGRGCPNHWERLPENLRTKTMLRREKLWDEELPPVAVLEYRCKRVNYFSNETYLYDVGTAKELKARTSLIGVN
jgi:hypothetical protein